MMKTKYKHMIQKTTGYIMAGAFALGIAFAGCDKKNTIIPDNAKQQTQKLAQHIKTLTNQENNKEKDLDSRVSDKEKPEQKEIQEKTKFVKIGIQLCPERIMLYSNKFLNDDDVLDTVYLVGQKFDKEYLQNPGKAVDEFFAFTKKVWIKEFEKKGLKGVERKFHFSPAEAYIELVTKDKKQLKVYSISRYIMKDGMKQVITLKHSDDLKNAEEQHQAEIKNDTERQTELEKEKDEMRTLLNYGKNLMKSYLTGRCQNIPILYTTGIKHVNERSMKDE